MTIQQQPCPRCRIRRTARLCGLFHCFNCRYQWTGSQVWFRFTAQELERLAIYRGAVRAGVYSDWSVFA
jgi:ribosomal protein L37AE/L43A